MFFKEPVKKTVDSVMTAFNATISDLEEVQAREAEEANSLEVEAERLQDRAKAAWEESKRAASVMAKLRALVAA